MMHMYCNLGLYLPQYTYLTDIPASGIASHRICTLLLQRASLKDVDRAGLVAERVADIPEQWE